MIVSHLLRSPPTPTILALAWKGGGASHGNVDISIQWSTCAPPSSPTDSRPPVPRACHSASAPPPGGRASATACRTPATRSTCAPRLPSPPPCACCRSGPCNPSPQSRPACRTRLTEAVGQVFHLWRRMARQKRGTFPGVPNPGCLRQPSNSNRLAKKSPQLLFRHAPQQNPLLIVLHRGARLARRARRGA